MAEETWSYLGLKVLEINNLKMFRSRITADYQQPDEGGAADRNHSGEGRN